MMIFFMVRTLAPRAAPAVIGMWPPCKKGVKGPASVAGEAVAESEVRVDVLPLRDGVGELLAQAGDVDVHGAVRRPVLLRPHGVVELLAADDAPRPLHERGQQLELADGEAQWPALGQRHVLVRSDLQL